MKSVTLKATIAALMAQVIFGFSFMFTKIALEYASPLTVIADRYIVAFIALTVVMLLKREKLRVSSNVTKLLLMSLFQPVLYFLFETYGIEMTTSGFSSVMISLIPVVSLFGGMLFLKEYPAPMQYGFTILSVLGVVIMALLGKSDGTVTAGGIILLFGAVISSVAYNVMSRKISGEFSVFERTYAMTLIGLVVFLSIAFAQNHNAPSNIFVNFLSTKYLLSILYLGLFSSVVAFLLLNYANTYLPVAKTTVFSNITTVVSVTAGIVFLNEKFSLETLIASAMIVIGVWGVQIFKVKKKE